MRKKYWEIKASATGADIYIYGDIEDFKWINEDVTAADIAEEIKALGDVDQLNIYINSYGGSVFAGQAIYSILKRHQARKNVYIDGIAASIASVIAMAGDAIYMPKNAMMMVHNAWTFTAGNADQLRKVADDLDKINTSIVAAYMDKVSVTEDKLKELLDAETWLTADECLEMGFCDEILQESRVAASISPEWVARYKNVPDSIQVAQVKGVPKDERDALVAEATREIETIKKILGGI